MAHFTFYTAIINGYISVSHVYKTMWAIRLTNSTCNAVG